MTSILLGKGVNISKIAKINKQEHIDYSIQNMHFETHVSWILNRLKKQSVKKRDTNIMFAKLT